MHTGIKTFLALAPPPPAALLALAAYGGGGSATTSGGGEGPATTIADLILPQARPADAGQAPVIQFGNELRAGGMPPPSAAGLASAPPHGQAAVRHGRVRDGLGASALTGYLQHDATGAENAPGHVRRFGTAPVVRFVTGTTAAQVGEIVRAVQLLNANLPHDFQIAVDSAAVPDPGPGHQRLPRGQILVEYDRREDWEIQAPGPTTVGRAQIYTTTTPGVIAYARVWVDQTRIPPGHTLETLLHELGHALGRLHPAPGRFPGTIMNNNPSRPEAGYELHPLDREALLAVYGTLQPGATPADIAADLGPWADESLHVRGDIGGIGFGAALRNGLARPWAAGPRPGIDLADNAQLSGSASWAGRLLGLTPAGATVAGAAGLGVDLATLTGDLDFTALESWAGAPGAPGSGAVFGDGDLNYGIAVRGNTFARASGDAGVVTGVFFGAGHEGMGGTLVRDDLAAGFAGTR